MIGSAHAARRRAADCSWARAASTRATARSRSRRSTCSPGPLERDQRAVRDRQDRRHQAVRGFNAQYGRRLPRASCRPTSTGPSDNYDLATSHVLPALIRKAHEAKAARRRARSSSGAAARRGASFSTSTTWPMPASSSWNAATTAPAAGQHRHRHGPHHRANSPSWCMDVVGYRGRDRLRPQQARRHAAQAPRRRPPERPRLARPHLAARRHRPRLRGVRPLRAAP